MHTAWVIFCALAGCSNWHLLWVSEAQERPNIVDAVPQAYELGWLGVEQRWYCPACAAQYAAQVAEARRTEMEIDHAE